MFIFSQFSSLTKAVRQPIDVMQSITRHFSPRQYFKGKGKEVQTLMKFYYQNIELGLWQETMVPMTYSQNVQACEASSWISGTKMLQRVDWWIPRNGNRPGLRITSLERSKTKKSRKQKKNTDPSQSTICKISRVQGCVIAEGYSYPKDEVTVFECAC